MEDVLSSERVTRLMQDYTAGSRDAAGQLVAIFYPELRRLAGNRMRGERSDHTWQPTVLVNELYMELRRVGWLKAERIDDEQRAAFLRLAAVMMKRMLIHHSRPLYRKAQKTEPVDMPDDGSGGPEDLAQIEELLERLAAMNPRFRTVVEMKTFEGLTIPEIADRLNCARSTVDRYWAFARQWLAEQIGGAALV